MGLEETGRKKVGLALGSGAARGLAHIGVLQVLEREGIPIDMISGTSIGALIGAFFAQGKNAGEILDIARDLGSHRLNYIMDMSIPKTGLIKGRKLENKLEDLFTGAEFKDLKVPFTCVSTDIDTGEPVIMSKGPVWKAVRASISLPVIFAVVKWNEKFVVDGGLINPVPVDVLKKMGADYVIAANVMPNRNIRHATEPNIFDVIMQTLHIVSYCAVKDSMEEADIVINPDVADFALSDFRKVDDCVKRGEEAAERMIPSIKRLLAG